MGRMIGKQYEITERMAEEWGGELTGLVNSTENRGKRDRERREGRPRFGFSSCPVLGIFGERGT